MIFKKSLLVAIACLPGLFLSAQSKAPENWFNLAPTADKVNGTAGDEALKMLKNQNKKSQTVIVAVLDSGVEVDHEDLKDVIWTNPGEIPGNGKDDDNNGYVDDIHGWNFLAGPGGNVNHESLEITREYARLKKRFEGTDPKNLHGDAAKEYKYWEKVKEDFEAQRADALNGMANATKQLKPIEDAFNTVETALAGKELTTENVAAIDLAGNEELKKSVDSFLS